MLPLDSSTTCKLIERSVWRHTLVHRLTKRDATRERKHSRAEHVGARTRALGGSRLRELDHHARDLTHHALANVRKQRSGFVLMRLLIEYLRRADEHG